MNSNTLYSYLSNQSHLMNGNIGELEKLTQEFPYFQTAHLLYSIASKKNDASIFQHSIKKTAIVAVNRNHLYELLYSNPTINKIDEPVAETKKETIISEKINTVEIEEEIEKPIEVTETLKEVKVEQAIDLAEQVEREIKKDLVEAFIEKEVLKTNEAHKKEEAPLPTDASFGQWLHFLKKNNGGKLSDMDAISQKTNLEEELKTEAPLSSDKKQKKEHQKELIDKIIEKNPSAIKLNKDAKFFVAEQKAKESLLENEHLVTETLAKIYALQGNTGKAIRAYQILSLKYPNKSVYFASLIENLKKGI